MKLIREKKIKIVNSNKNQSFSYQIKSISSMKAAKILLKEKLYEEATSMFYYAMYNKSMSLLFLVGIDSRNHYATISLLNEIFDLDISEIQYAKKERIDKQYYADFNVTEKMVLDLLMKTENFLATIENYISNLNYNKIKRIIDEINTN